AAGRYAADCQNQIVVAVRRRSEGDGRRILGKGAHVGDLPALKLTNPESGHGDRHVLQSLLAPLGGDDYILQSRRLASMIVGFRRSTARLSQGDGGQDQR